MSAIHQKLEVVHPGSGSNRSKDRSNWTNRRPILHVTKHIGTNVSPLAHTYGPMRGSQRPGDGGIRSPSLVHRCWYKQKMDTVALQTHSGDPNRQQWGEILPMNKASGRASGHPLSVDKEVLWGKDICRLMGNGEQHGLLVRSLEGTRLKFRDKEVWGRGKQMGLLEWTQGVKILVSYVNTHQRSAPVKDDTGWLSQAMLASLGSWPPQVCTTCS